MNKLERVKTQSVLDKIISGAWDLNDVDPLFTKLREYCDGNLLFREVGDHIAHKRLRDKGSTQQFISAFFLSIAYYIDYGLPRIPVDFRKPFPIWVKHHMKFQVDKCNPNELKKKFNICPKDLKSHIQSLFKEDKEAETAAPAKPIKDDSSLMIQYILNSIHLPNPLFTVDDLMKDLVAVLHKNKFSFDENALIARRDTIILCVMLLLHHTEFDVIKNSTFTAFIGSANPASQKNQLAAGDVGKGLIEGTPESLGVTVPVTFTHDRGQFKAPATVFIPVFISDLSVNDYCEKELLTAEMRWGQDPKNPFCFTQALRLTPNLKLGLFLITSNSV